MNKHSQGWAIVNIKMPAMVLAAIVLSFPITSFAQGLRAYWVANGDGNWKDPGSWSWSDPNFTSHVPDVFTEVYIGPGGDGNLCIIDSTTSALANDIDLQGRQDGNGISELVLYMSGGTLDANNLVIHGVSFKGGQMAQCGGTVSLHGSLTIGSLSDSP